MKDNLIKVMNEIDKIAEALDIEISEFGERAMRALVLSTGYSYTKDAVDDPRVTYRRALNLKVGIAVATVFEMMNTTTIPKEQFLEDTTTSYMRLSGMSALDQVHRKNETKGLVTLYLKRIENLGLITYKTINGVRHVKIEPEIGSCSFASIMNPESMTRTPYMKAMAQTIGSMALVDRDQNKWTSKEITDEVQDRLQKIKGDGRLLTRKIPDIFFIKNIAPFHIEKNVPFYDNLEDGNLIILPTFPEPGTILNSKLDKLSKRLHTPLICEEIAFEYFGETELTRLTSGHNPVLIQIGTGSNTMYFNRNEKDIRAMADFLKSPLSKFYPRQGTMTQSLIEIQSKLGYIDYNGSAVEKVIQGVLEQKIAENDYESTQEREVISVLHSRLKLIRLNEDKYFVPVINAESLLKELKGYCNLSKISTKPISNILTDKGEGK